MVDARYGGKWAWLAGRGRCTASRPEWQAGRNGWVRLDWGRSSNSIPEDGDARVVGVLVDAHDEHGRVGRRRGDDDLLTAALDVQLRLLDGREDAGRLDHVLDAALAPRNLRRVLPAHALHDTSPASLIPPSLK